ncbi:MAG: hypothetical protein N2515_03660, partial [Deltaproteobacteria bacterium]|nr:hypothetical protein [Deltaproteobacteria bacterium]
MSRCESLVWPIKLLDRLLPREDVVSVLLETLNGMDTEYQRDPQKKLQLLQALEERRDGRIAKQVFRFLDDVNESVRFHAISTLLHQENVDEFKDQILT